jgi:sulfur carrier protein
MSLNITLNGKPFVAYKQKTIEDLLVSLEYKIQNIAVEINGSLCPRSQYSATQITDGMSIEIVSFVGGG